MHVRCPHCHQPVELVGNTGLEHIDCPSCGSAFSLLGDQTGSYHAGETRTIGHFELIEQLGMGQFGTVWMARDTELDRTVAIKIPRREELSREDVEMFLREARAAAQLHHPNIVNVHEVGRNGDTVFIVSDLVRGATLADRLTGQRLSPREAAKLCVTIAEALQHAHQAGVIHRDLKPSNIMIDAEGQPHLMDFGLAKREAGEITMTVDGRILGTPAYMSPEQARGEAHHADARSDIYSLGAVLFELLTGELPFRGNKRMLLMQIIHDEPPSPRKLDAAVPRDLETICLKCLEKSPDRRYSTARELADDLWRFVNGESISARPFNRAERFWKWSKRHPAAAALTAVSLLSLLLIVAGLAVGMVLVSRARDRTLDAYHDLELEQAKTKAALERQRRLSYGRGISLALGEWSGNNVARADEILEACPTDLRNWEWEYVRRLCHQELLSLTAPAAGAYGVAFHPSGKLLAVGGGSIGYGPFVSNQELQFYNLENGQARGDFRPGVNHGAITDLSFSRDGKLLAVALWCMDDARDVLGWSKDTGEESAGRLELWNIEERRLVHSLKSHHSFVYGVAFSPAGDRVASASSDATAHVWDVASGRQVFTLVGHRGQIMDVAYSPNNLWIATCAQGPLSTYASWTLKDEGELKLWDAKNGAEIISLAGHLGGVLAVTFSPDSKWLASAGRDRTIRVWDTATGRLERILFGHSDEVTGVCFSADGRLLASVGKDRTVRLWNPLDGDELQVLRGHSQPLTAVAFHSNDHRLATAAASPSGAEAKLWDADQRRESVVCSGHPENVKALALSADGKMLATASGGGGGNSRQTIVFDPRTGAELWRLASDNGLDRDQLGFSTDSRHLAQLSTRSPTLLNVLDTSTKQNVLDFEIPGSKREGYYGATPLLSPRYDLVASVDLDHGCAVIHATSDGSRLADLSGLAEGEVTLAFSPDASRLAAVSDIRTSKEGEVQWSTSEVKVWDIRTGTAIFAHRPTHFYGWNVSFAPDGNVLALHGSVHEDEEHLVKRFDLQTGRELPEIPLGKTTCDSIHFNRRGDRLVTVQHPKAWLVKVWDVTAARELFTLADFAPPHTTSDYHAEVEFMPDDRRIVTCGDDTVKLWDADNGQLLMTLRPALSPMRLSHDGKQIIAAGPAGTVRVWSTGE